MPRYFLGVATSRELFDQNTTLSFWCVPADAKMGDVILLYCPRSASEARQGIFAQAVVSTSSGDKNKENSLCSGYGLGVTPLWHVAIRISKRFRPSVTAKDLKRDSVMMRVGFVRKNFQGTTFSLEESEYRRIIDMAAKKKDAENAGENKYPMRGGIVSGSKPASKNEKSLPSPRRRTG